MFPTIIISVLIQLFCCNQHQFSFTPGRTDYGPGCVGNKECKKSQDHSITPLNYYFQIRSPSCTL